MEFRLEKLEQSADIITIGLIGYTHNRIKGVDTAIKALALLGQTTGYKLLVGIIHG